MPKVLTRMNGPPAMTRPQIVAELKLLQRQRAIVLKSRNMQANRLQAIVAGTLGYYARMPENERKRKFQEAATLIKEVAEGSAECDMKAIIQTTLIGIDAFNKLKNECERKMVLYAKHLPVAAWVDHKDQRGFGPLFLAIVVGESGDLANYANPGKLWRRLSCAPWTFDAQTLMGATWRSGKQGKLPAEAWEAYGYSPRRRSITFLIGEGIVKQNGSGPYRQRYDDAKMQAEKAHPEWTECVCEGTGKNKAGGKCIGCGGRGRKLLRCHRHAMLLATKLLLKNLWVEWTQ